MSTRIAIVAGAGSGLGQATALALHAAGYTVVAVDRSESGLNELPDAIAHREVADATDPAVPVPLVDKIATKVGAPNVLVNTIGAFELSDALSTTPDGLRALTDVNVGAALWLTQAVAPHMERNGSGAIVHITARPGIEPTPGYAEQVFFHEVTPSDALASASIVNRKLGVGLEVMFSPNTLNYLTQWKQMGYADYTVGIEPGNCLPEGRVAARSADRLESAYCLSTPSPRGP